MGDISIDDFSADSFEFGIDFADSNEPNESDKVREVVHEATGNLDTKLDDLQNRMAEMVDQMDMSETKALITQNAKQQVIEMAQIIVPLLLNLKKSPNKDNIVWPGEKRIPMIDAQLSKMQAILDR